MATKINIPSKVAGNTLSAPEFNAVVTAINENATSLEDAFSQITSKLGTAIIKINSTTSITISTVEELIEYLHKYGTSTDKYNTAPIIKISKKTLVYKAGESLDLDLELFDSEGGFLTLTGTCPAVSGGYNTFVLGNLRSGINSINFNELIFNDTTTKLPVGTYIFSDIYVTDALGRSSASPINIKVIVAQVFCRSY